MTAHLSRIKPLCGETALSLSAAHHKVISIQDASSLPDFADELPYGYSLRAQKDRNLQLSVPDEQGQ